MSGGLAALLCVGLSLPAQRTAAQTSSLGIVTTVDPCVPIDLAHFHRLLEIELGTSIEARTEATLEPGRTWVHLSCGRLGIELTLEDGITRKSMVRVLDLGQIESASRTRLLALAVAEFVVASWVELRAVPRPALPPVGPPPPAAATAVAERTIEARAESVPAPAAAPARALWQLGLGLGVESYPRPAALMPALSLRLLQAATPWFGILLGADGSMVRVDARQDAALVGYIDVMTATGLAALQFGGAIGDFDLFGGAGARFGVVYMSSTVSEQSSLVSQKVPGALASVSALTRAGYRLGDVRLGLELEIGWVTLPASAELPEREGLERRTVFELKGLRLGASVSASLLL